MVGRLLDRTGYPVLWFRFTQL